MAFFEFPIWDRHKFLKFDEEGNQFIVPVYDNNDPEPFKKLSARIDTEQIKIEHIVEFMLFQTEDEAPIRSSFIYCSDGSQYICRYLPETIEKNYLLHLDKKPPTD
jgi:hypothetical protein